MSLLDVVKTDLRISHNALDLDIQVTIDSCLIDLKVSGVFNVDENDALIAQAVKLYCRANVGFQKDSEKYRMAYDSLKTSLSLCGDYNTEKTEGGADEE